MATYNPGSVFAQSSGYGYRINPLTGSRSKFHGGEDYSAPTGTPIPAAADGRVYFSGYLNGYGNVIVIEHNIDGERVYTLYAHLDEPSPLNTGDSVSQGQVVGNVGSTGDSTGPHLHFEVISNQPNPLQKGHETINPERFGFPGDGTDGTGSSDPTVPSDSYDRTRDPDAFKDLAAATPQPVRVDPLILDLDGDGIETTAVNRYGAHFDLDANGFAESVGWVSSDDGILVRDLNGDGVINDGAELFGDHTLLKNGETAASAWYYPRAFETPQNPYFR
jgi:hypothetical protein